MNPENFDFGVAIHILKNGGKVARQGWNGKGMYLLYFSPVKEGFEDFDVVEHDICLPLLPFILMKTADDCLVPWLASQTDILAEDWCVI
jgi:hypothetical protein